MNINRKHIEYYILGSLINQDIALPLDEIEFLDMTLEYKLFKSTITSKMVAKAIYNMQVEKFPVCDVTVLDYIKKRTNKLDEHLFYEIVGSGHGSYLSILRYLEYLKEIDKNDELMERLKVLR